MENKKKIMIGLMVFVMLASTSFAAGFGEYQGILNFNFNSITSQSQIWTLINNNTYAVTFNTIIPTEANFTITLNQTTGTIPANGQIQPILVTVTPISSFKGTTNVIAYVEATASSSTSSNTATINTATMKELNITANIPSGTSTSTSTSTTTSTPTTTTPPYSSSGGSSTAGGVSSSTQPVITSTNTLNTTTSSTASTSSTAPSTTTSVQGSTTISQAITTTVIPLSGIISNALSSNTVKTAPNGGQGPLLIAIIIIILIIVALIYLLSKRKKGSKPASAPTTPNSPAGVQLDATGMVKL